MNASASIGSCLIWTRSDLFPEPTSLRGSAKFAFRSRWVEMFDLPGG